MSLDMRTIRMGINGTLITAQCTQPDCGWAMTFTPLIRLSQINDTCAGHPCKSELVNELRTIVCMTPNEGMALLRLLLARHDKTAEMGA
jgi:hypothetical protein